MSLHHAPQHFDVIGSGFVHEHHADPTHHHLGLRQETSGSRVGSRLGSLLGSLAFAAIAALIVAATTESIHTAGMVLANAQ